MTAEAKTDLRAAAAGGQMPRASDAFIRISFLWKHLSDNQRSQILNIVKACAEANQALTENADAASDALRKKDNHV